MTKLISPAGIGRIVRSRRRTARRLVFGQTLSHRPMTLPTYSHASRHISRYRDPLAWDFGTYQLVDGREGWVVAEQMADQGYGMSLDDIEEWLTGRAVRMYKITALMKPRSFPAITVEQRERFTDAIGQLFSRMILPPSVQWDEHDQAQVTLASGGENATEAADRAREIIDRNAANVAYIYVREIDVLQAEHLEGWTHE